MLVEAHTQPSATQLNSEEIEGSRVLIPGGLELGTVSERVGDVPGRAEKRSATLAKRQRATSDRIRIGGSRCDGMRASDGQSDGKDGDGEKDKASGGDQKDDGGKGSGDGGGSSGGEKKDKDSGGGGDKKGGTGGKEGGEDDHPVRKAKWPWVLAGVLILLFVLIVLWVIYSPHPVQRTDDAYVRAHYTKIAPRVSGEVVSVGVNDNQPVRRGDLLIQVDPRDYQAALDKALAQAAQDRAQILQTQAQITRQPAIIQQAQAQLLSARAALALAKANARRYSNLAQTGAGSQQQRQTSDAQLQQDEASVLQAAATIKAASDQLSALVADRKSAEAKVQADEAEIEQARLNLSYTRVVAPIDGLVDQRSVQVGDYVSPGAAVMAVVPLHAVYIEANYRELALQHMLPGQHVRIHLDAYRVWLDGYVEGVAAASGAAFSPIPPNNATGNFTKIVQRLPVKIVVAPNQPLARLLRVGMSVETYVDTGLAPVVSQQQVTQNRVVNP